VQNCVEQPRQEEYGGQCESADIRVLGGTMHRGSDPYVARRKTEAVN
jgi:hypothetical protein